MLFGHRVNSLALSLTAIICWLIAFGTPEVQASCGNYLHTRLGPPQQAPYGSVGPVQHGLPRTEGWISRVSNSTLPLPCSGPNCGRSSTPPFKSPATPAQTVDRPQEFAATMPDAVVAASASGRHRLNAEKPILQTVPWPIDVPPEC